MFTIKPGTCGISGCKEAHEVTVAPEMWKGVTQYRGTHHGETFIYETWMVTQYRKVTADEATTLTNVQAYQAGAWYDVDRVTVAGNDVAIHFVNGGTHVQPKHFVMLRVVNP